MRRVTAHLFHSLDGIVSAPHFFQFDSFDADLGAAMDRALAPVDTVVLGRVAYQEWAAYWPANPGDEFGDFINPVRKLVASRTLTGPLEWQNSSLIEGDLLDTVRALRAEDGGDVTVVGISVIRQLFLAGLVDALTLTTHPVVAGSGTRLFESAEAPLRLTLLESQATQKGNVMSTYGVRTD